MSGIQIADITSKTLLGATFAQAAYSNTGGAAFTPPVGFQKIELSNEAFKPTATSSLTGFAAQAYVNVQTGELVIAYRGSDNPLEATNAASWASNGTWHPQFTDATNFAAAARAAALVKVNDYRETQKQTLLTQFPDDKILVTGHSLGGLLSQVVSKMFGWSAQVYDSLGGGKLVYSTDPVTGNQVFSAGFTEQANKLGLTLDGHVVDHDVSGKIQNWGTSKASDVGLQLGTQVDIPALGQMGGGTSAAVVLAFLVNPLLGIAAAYGGDQFIGKHNKFTIEDAVYSLGTLKDLVKAPGELQVRLMSLSEAKGESDPILAAQGPKVPALVDADGNVWAYYERIDSSFKVTVTQGENQGVALRIGRSGEASNSDIQITRINKDNSEHTYSRDELIQQLKVPGKDYLSKTIYERYDEGVVQEVTLADGSTQYRLLSDKGVSTALPSNEYVGHTEDGALAKFQLSADGNTEGGIILSGVRAGETFTRVWHNGNPALRMGAVDDGTGRQLDYTLTYTDKNGRGVSIDSRPVFSGEGQDRTLVGVQSTTTVVQSGVKLQETISTQTLDSKTQQSVSSQDSKKFDTNGQLLERSFQSQTETTSGLLMSALSVSYDKSGNITATVLTERQDNNVMRTTVRNGAGATVQMVDKQIYDDGTAVELKTENGQQYVRSIVPKSDGSAETETSDWKSLTTGKTQSQEQATNAMYSDMAGFVNALRGKDKVNQLLYAAKIGLNYQIANGAQNATILGLNQNHLAGLSAVAGVVAGLRALRSDDTKTQISGAVGLVSSANNLYSLGSTGGESISAGFLSPAQAGALQLVGAAISIANLKHLDEMIDNGQYGSAMATLYGAYVGATAIGTVMAAETVSAGIAEIMAGASAAGPVGLYIAVGAIVLDSMFAEDPPPPPPVGGALFKLDAKGKLVWEYDAQTNDLGRSVLAPHMQAMADKLKTYVQESNKDVIDVDRQYVLLASRLPKVYIQSWPSYTDNGKTNFYFALEQKHPQTGELVYSNVARDDIDSDYAAYTVMPEALVQRWQVATMSGKFGADESKWLTEGQWANGNSALEQQRAKLAKAMDDAQKALTEVKTTKYVQDGEQVMAVSASPQELAAAEQRLKAAMGALQVYDAEHPQNGDTAAREVDATLVAQMQSLKASDPEAYLKAYNKARDEATQQWMKVIALDWDGDGKIAHIAAPARTQTDLVSLQTDGATRFDVDGDGYREVTEWINPSDAMLGIDLDGDGVIGNSRELFNAAATAFDQRGWGSLKYYDSNNDNKIDRSDAVFKLLRLWVDINGDGTAGTMETFTLDMDYVGVDMTKLKASLDAAGQQALATLQQLKVQSIDLSTMKFKLADGSQVQASTEQLKADVLGTQVWLNESKKPVVAVEQKDGKRQLDAPIWREASATIFVNKPIYPMANPSSKKHRLLMCCARRNNTRGVSHA